MRSLADLGKIFADFWRAKGRFHHLARISNLRAVLTALTVLGGVLGLVYLLQYQPSMESLWEMSDVESYVTWHEALGLGEKKESVSQLSSRLSMVGDAIERSTDTAEVITHITSAAESSKVKFEAINPMEANQKGDYSSTAITLRAKANYGDLIAFIRTLEKSDRFVNVIAISLNKTSDPSGELDVSITLETYQRSAGVKQTKAGG